MKNIFLLLTLSFYLLFSSCEKEPITEPVKTADSNEIKGISLNGRWLLIGGKMYMENLETGDKVVYNHFDSTKTKSTLRYEGAFFNIEKLELNVTTWAFYKPKRIPGCGRFILNGDSANQYGFNMTTSNWTIIESPTSGIQQMGGSARPISADLINYNEKIVEFKIQETYNSIKGENWTYFSMLKFKKIKEW